MTDASSAAPTTSLKPYRLPHVYRGGCARRFVTELTRNALMLMGVSDGDD